MVFYGPHCATAFLASVALPHDCSKLNLPVQDIDDAGSGMGLGVLNSMLGPTLSPDLLCKLACTRLVSHMIVPLRANHRGTLPSSRLAKQGAAYFILF